MSTSIIIKEADTKEELEQILKLQDQNNVQNIRPENRQSNGFLTIRHDLALLTEMSQSAGQIVAKDQEKLVGYALVMLKEFRETVPLLFPMFEMFDNLSFKGKPLNEHKFYVMGQICVAEAYRGQGIFEALYRKHKEIYSDRYDILLTEVSVNNPRSMKAHENVGFQVIHRFKDETEEWNIVLWDWKKK